MGVAKSVLRKGVCLLIAVLASSGAGAGLATPAAAANVDVFLVNAGVDHSFLTPSLSSGWYSLTGGACLDRPLPSPLSGEVPSYLNAPGLQSGVCSSVTGGGNLLTVCTTGSITAGWTLAEPGENDGAVFDGQGVMVEGVAVLVGTPVSALPGLGYADPPTTSSVGSAVAVAVFLPAPVAVCGKDDIMKTMVAGLVAAY